MQIKELTKSLEDAIDKGTVAIGSVHKKLARKPYDLASQVGPLAGSARKGRELQDRMIDLFYSSVRNINHAVFRRVNAMAGTATVPTAGEATPADEPSSPSRRGDGGART